LDVEAAIGGHHVFKWRAANFGVASRHARWPEGFARLRILQKRHWCRFSSGVIDKSVGAMLAGRLGQPVYTLGSIQSFVCSSSGSSEISMPPHRLAFKTLRM
jgi:hypothetical protein